MQLENSMYKQLLADAPLAVFEAPNYRLIPAALTPLVLDAKEWEAVKRDAVLIFSAMEKVIVWLRLPAQSAISSALFKELSPIEYDAAMGRLEPHSGMATLRMDLFFDGTGLKVIEVNSTIPAMQAYSDMIYESFVRSMAEAKNLAPDKLSDWLNAQSNVNDLLASLLDQYKLAGGTKERPTIAIVARQNDSQLAELLWLRARWEIKGYKCLLASPEEITIDDSYLYVKGEQVDLTYRHIFAHRLVAGSPFEQACRRSKTYRVFNPVAAHFEVKGVLAELSRLASDASLSKSVSLSEAERKAVLKRVPWTRLIGGDDAAKTQGKQLESLVEWFESHKKRVVIKCNYGYGGHNVLIGALFDQEEFQRRAIKIMGEDRKISWREFIRFCVQDQTRRWIVQEIVAGRRMEIQYLHQDQVLSRTVHVDCSVFLSRGSEVKAGGGASRFADSTIVNIGTGGGLLPLITSDVAKNLLQET